MMVSATVYAINGLAIVLFVFWCGKWMVHILAIVYGKYRLHRKIEMPSLQHQLQLQHQHQHQHQQHQPLLVNKSPALCAATGNGLPLCTGGGTTQTITGGGSASSTSASASTTTLAASSVSSSSIVLLSAAAAAPLSQLQLNNNNNNNLNNLNNNLNNLSSSNTNKTGSSNSSLIMASSSLSSLDQHHHQHQHHNHHHNHHHNYNQYHHINNHNNHQPTLLNRSNGTACDLQLLNTCSPVTKSHTSPSSSSTTPTLSSTPTLLSSSPLSSSLPSSSSAYPSVSILKPLMGTDPNLMQNLETFFTMDYDVYELLFCLEDENDPAIEVVRKLTDIHPHIDARLFVGGSNVGVNPKINNMNPGYEAAKYEYILISDSGIRMRADTLLDMVQHMTKDIGIVHQMPFTCDRDGFAASFEKIYFGTVQSRIYLCSDLLGITCHTGMSCLIRKNVLDQMGGLRTFGCYLAEDFFLAKQMTEKGWKLSISSQPALQNSGICDIGTFQARLMRWAKLRVAMLPGTILLEPLSECMIVGAFASWSVAILFHWDPLVFYLIHILMWFLSDWMMLSIVQNGPLPFNKFEFVVGWLFRECSGPYLFLMALFNPAIRWRSRVYKLAWGGLAYELTTKITS